MAEVISADVPEGQLRDAVLIGAPGFAQDIFHILWLSEQGEMPVSAVGEVRTLSDSLRA